MKATIGAPSFFIKDTNILTAFSNTANLAKWDIHYLEYSEGTTLIDNVESSSPSFISLNGNGANDAITGTFYQKDAYLGIDLPNVFTIINPLEGSSLRRKRWFPGAFIKRDVDQYKARIDTYNNLLATYNTEVQAYNDKVK